MPRGPLDPRQLGYFYTLAQVGLEMAAPIGLGVALDYALDWAPFGTIVGALLGLIGGLAHLVVLAQRPRDADPAQPRRDAP